MKTLNLYTHFSILTLTLILSGCMPDSLTKYKKDPPKKTSSSTKTSPVTDSSGNVIPFDPPTKFYFYNETTPTLSSEVGQGVSVQSVMDGTLSNPSLASTFLERCEMVRTGPTITQTLPPGLYLDTTTCRVYGTPLSVKTVDTAFCSDSTILDQVTCESTSFTWNSSTSTCSNLDLKYSNSSACTTGKNTWYSVGSQIPYQFKVTYHDSTGTQHFAYATFRIGAYVRPSSLSYTQNDKLLLTVSNVAGTYSAITPVTSNTTTGSYAKTSLLISETGNIGVTKIVDSSLNMIGIDKLVAITLPSVSGFIKNNFIIKSSDATIYGKIYSVNSTTKTIYVENLSSSNKYFTQGMSVCSKGSSPTFPLTTAACGTAQAISSIDESYIFSSGDKLDNDNQYFVNKYSISKIVNAYEINQGIKPLDPITSTSISSSNGVSYKISPSLPCAVEGDPNQCISIDSTTGEISGTFSDNFDSTEFTITATNPLGSTTTTLYLNATSAPKDLNISNRQIIVASNTALFTEGEILTQPITPPLSYSATAKILKILNSYQVAIEPLVGTFSAGASLDSGNTTYFGEKAYIIPADSCVDTDYNDDQTTCEALYPGGWSTGDVFYNTAITVNSTGDFTTGGYINSITGTGTGAKGIIQGIQVAASDILFVKFLTPDTSNVKYFYIGDGVGPSTASVTTVKYIESAAMKLGLTSAAGFSLGADITSSGNLGAYTDKITSNTLYLTDITYKNSSATPFIIGQTIHNDESTTTASATTTVTSVSNDPLFVVDRLIQTIGYNSSLSNGTGVVYSITPALPSGLTLDTKTGKISGSATSAIPRKDFILKAQNFLGSSQFAFSLEVRDYFAIATDTSSTPSFILHKVGDTQINRDCKINSRDILSGSPVAKALDIRCFLEAEEEDLYFNSLKISSLVGPGICEYIQYYPYYFNQYSPLTSKGVSSKYTSRVTVNTGCYTGPNSTAPTASLCEAYHATTADPSAPNCDEGYLEYNTQSYSDSGGGCISDGPAGLTSGIKVYCGGKKVNCIAGPAKEIFTNAQLESGIRSNIYSSSLGSIQTWTHSSPISNENLTNIRLTNHTVNNQCYTTSTDASTWITTVGSQAREQEPFSRGNPYYTINCLDSAKEIKARIRLVVRDWDKAFKINSNIDSMAFGLSASTTMNSAGTDPIFNNSYNNISDWDDDYSGLNCLGAPCSLCPGDTSKTTQTACEAAGQRWVGSWYSGGSCGSYNGAITDCTGSTWITVGDCSNMGGTWSGGNCKFANQFQCERFGGTWTGDRDYKFPADQI